MDNKSKRILFFGFGDVGYKCLKYMLDNNYNVVGVFTHDRDPHENDWFQTAESLALSRSIPVFKPASLKDPKWAQEVEKLSPDLILSLYYRNRIPESVFSQARLGAYNMHGSYLPSYKGRAPLNWAILNGENYTGVSLHVLEKDFDTGDIVARKKVDISPDDYVGDVQPKVSAAAVEIFAQTLPKLLDSSAERIKQSRLQGESSYFGKRRPEDSRIDFSKSAAQIRNLVRAVSRPFNGAFFDKDGKRYILWRADVEPSADNSIAGAILENAPERLKVAAKGGVLASRDFQIIDIPQD